MPDEISAPGGHPAKLSAPVDVAAFIDAQPVSRFQISILVTCAAVLFADGFDTQAIGYVAPELAKEWGLSKTGLAPVFSAGLFGLMIGALVFGPLADRVGRKAIIVLSTFAFGVMTLATFFAGSVEALIAMRFLTGLGLGGAMPNAVALTSEFSPHRRRATMVMIMFCGFSVGAALGGLLAAALIPNFGWRSVFLVGGLAPILLAPYLALRLPESVRFLALSGKADIKVGALLARIAPSAGLRPGARYGVDEPKLDGIPIGHLFSDGRSTATILLWIVFFMSLLDLYLLSNWLPTILSDLGASVSAAAAIGAMLQVGGVVGTIVLGRVIDTFSYKVLALTYLIAVLAIAAIGQFEHSSALVTLAIFVSGFCIVGGQIAANALAATFYPTAARSAGVGWALGVGRAGSIVGPLVGGVLLSMHWSMASVFAAGAVPALCAALAALALSRAAARIEGSPSAALPTASASQIRS